MSDDLQDIEAFFTELDRRVKTDPDRQRAARIKSMRPLLLDRASRDPHGFATTMREQLAHMLPPKP